MLDNQKALTVRSAFLQNREYMDVFYREGYTVMEMEGGPYLSSAYEIAEPRRHPQNEIVSLVDQNMFELGVIHYASRRLQRSSFSTSMATEKFSLTLSAAIGQSAELGSEGDARRLLRLVDDCVETAALCVS